MKYYLDEDLSPKIAKLLRENQIDCSSVHENNRIQLSDREQLEFAAYENRCLVTKNRDDFIKLTVQFFNSQLPHHGILIIPYSYPGDQFSKIAEALKHYAGLHPSGMAPYTVDFLAVNWIKIPAV